MNIERKLKNLEREIRYYSRVYPGCNKLKVLKSIYRHYKKNKS